MILLKGQDDGKSCPQGEGSHGGLVGAYPLGRIMPGLPGASLPRHADPVKVRFATRAFCKAGAMATI